jgi:ribonucleoside-diphosphate reductase alpha chain
MLSWKLGLKANALYRDGSKLSQPLSNKSDRKKKAPLDEPLAEEETAPGTALVDLGRLTIEELLEEVQKRVQASPDTQLKRQLARIVERRTLPARRKGFTYKAKVGGQPIFVRTGEYDDNTLGEIFIDLAKEGSTLRSLMNCFAISISVGLQYGVPLEEFVDKFVFTRFDPSGMVDHPNIKSATSMVDYVFRLLGYEYLGRTDLVHVLQAPEVGNTGTEEWDEMPTLSEKQPELSQVRVTAPASGTQQYMQRMQSDAPACNTCGHITVRSGTCYKCLNCGNSMGCS